MARKQPKDPPPTHRCDAKCGKCGSTHLQLGYEATSHSLNDFEIHGTMSHRGMGWDLSWFKATCAACGSPDVVFETTKIGKGGAGDGATEPT